MGGVNQQNVNFIWFAKPRSGQVLAVRRDDLFVPVKAVFPAPLEGAAAVVVLIHIDEAVALFHLCGGRAHQVQTAPAGITSVSLLPPGLTALRQ